MRKESDDMISSIYPIKKASDRMERAGFARRTLPRWKTVTKDWEQPEGAEGHRQNEWMTVGSSPLSRHDWRWTRRKKEERTRPDEVRKRWGMRWTKWWKTRSRPAHGLYVFHFPLSIVSRLLPSWSPASCSLRRYALRSLCRIYNRDFINSSFYKSYVNCWPLQSLHHSS